MAEPENTEAILRDFDGLVASLDLLQPKVEELLGDLLDDRGMRFHSVQARVKDRASLARKLSRKKPPYGSLHELTDLLGARITTYFHDDVDAVASLIGEQFDVDAANSVDHRAGARPEQFGYVGVHVVVSLSSARQALPEWSRFAKLKFEIQIRSILQHAWAEIEHDRGYHTENDVPAPIRRRWSRLAALLELADSEFVTLRDGAVQPARGEQTGDHTPVSPATVRLVPVVAVTSAGGLVAGQSSHGRAAIAVTFVSPLDPPPTEFRIALETPGVAFEGSLVVTTAVPAEVRLDPDGQAIAVELRGQPTGPVSVVVGGIRLRAQMTVPLGAVRASLSIGDGPRMAIGSLGTVGPSLGVDVRSAATPTVLRGAANQATGQLAVTEQTAGALGGPAAGRFLVRLRLVALPDGSDGRGSAMSSAPWIVVTGGDLKFEVPEGLGATIVRGRPSNDGTFAEWIVSSPSTLPSTFEVRGSAGPDVPLPAGPLNGPRVDIGWPESLRTLGLSVEVIDPETRFLEIKGLDVVAYADGGSGQREVRNR